MQIPMVAPATFTATENSWGAGYSGGYTTASAPQGAMTFSASNLVNQR